VRLLGVFFIARYRRCRLRTLPPLVMLRHQLGRRSSVRQIDAALGGFDLRGALPSPCLLCCARSTRPLDFGRQDERGAAREVDGGELTLREQLIFDGDRRLQRDFELALAPLDALRFVASCFDVPQRIRESAHLAVDVLCADSPERVERIFSRHDALMLAHANAENQLPSVYSF
jgi:hypothetical protein